MGEYKKLDNNTINLLENKILETLAPYFDSIGMKDNSIFKPVFYNLNKDTQWFAFSAKCPICQNKNETGYCLVGITNHDPYEVSIHCKRLQKSLPYIKEENGKQYITNGSDTYIMTAHYNDSDTAYWALTSQDVNFDSSNDNYNELSYFENEEYEAEAREWEEEHPIYDGDGLTDSQQTWDDAVDAAADLEIFNDDYDGD